MDLATEIINHVQIRASFQRCRPVKRQEGRLDIFLCIFKVQDERAVFARIGTVQAGQRLHCRYVLQLLVHIHGVEQRFVKAGLILVRNDQNVILAAVECFAELFVGSNVFAVSVQIHSGFGERLLPRVICQRHLAGERDHHIAADALVGMIGEIFLDREIIANCVCAAVRHDHGFALAAI